MMEILRRDNSIKNSTEPVRSDNSAEVIFFNYVNDRPKSLENISLPLKGYHANGNVVSNLSNIKSQQQDSDSSENEENFTCDIKDELALSLEETSGDNCSLSDMCDDLTNDSILMTDDILKGLMVGIYNDQQKITKKGILFRSNSDSQLILSNRQSQTTRLAGFNCFSTSNLRSRNMMSYLFEMSQKTTISNRKKSDTRVFTKPFRKLRKYLSKKRKKKTEEF